MHELKFWCLRLLYLLVLLVSNIGFAEDQGAVNLTSELPALDIIYNNSVVTITRNQNTENTIKGPFAKTSRPCPPACIVPIQPVKDIIIVGELELLEFMEKEYLANNGLIIDAREARHYSFATIPGSVNLPAEDFANLDTEKSNYLKKIVNATVRPETGKLVELAEKFGFIENKTKTADYDFTGAKKILIWDSGPWSADAHKVIAAFLETGYPEEYLHYYHGGMQSWVSLGLTIIKP